jgi:2,4-dichlorophenol 6-monooxygenase
VRHGTRQVSTLDLAGHGQFSLLVGIGGQPWGEAAAKIAAELNIALPVYAVGYHCDYDDLLGDWTRLREIGDRGALLIRPDRYVAWRCPDLPESPQDSLRAALRQLLALPTP